jgi:ABC-type branched-subunit amino acid transport system permease subunit
VLLGTAPLWISKVGLYPYLALEIMVWMIFALGYNLLLGHGGLPVLRPRRVSSGWARMPSASRN